MHRILHRAVDDIDAIPPSNRGEVIAVLRLLRLEEKHQTAARGHEVIDGRDLRRGVDGAPDARGGLPLIRRAVREHEHVHASKSCSVECAIGPGFDEEAGRAQLLGCLGIGRISRIGRRHPERDLGTGRPGLSMALIDEHAGNGAHDFSWGQVATQAGGISYLIREDLRQNSSLTGQSPVIGVGVPVPPSRATVASCGATGPTP